MESFLSACDQRLADSAARAETATGVVTSPSELPRFGELLRASEPARARAAELALLGQLLASQVATSDASFGNIWNKHVVPLAVVLDCEWQLGMTASLSGLTSAAGAPFNGRVGRLMGRNIDSGRWEVLLGYGKDGNFQQLNVKPENLKAATRDEILSLFQGEGDGASHEGSRPHRDTSCHGALWLSWSRQDNVRAFRSISAALGTATYSGVCASRTAK
jgi:hypothetical protein